MGELIKVIVYGREEEILEKFFCDEMEWSFYNKSRVMNRYGFNEPDWSVSSPKMKVYKNGDYEMQVVRINKNEL
jgi:hypothetical protein